MRDQKRKRLETKGWHVGSAKDFLGLSNREAKHIKLTLQRMLSKTKLSEKDAIRLGNEIKANVAKRHKKH